MSFAKCFVLNEHTAQRLKKHAFLGDLEGSCKSERNINDFLHIPVDLQIIQWPQRPFKRDCTKLDLTMRKPCVNYAQTMSKSSETIPTAI